MISQQTIKKWFPLFLISSLGLFLELAVIRWLSAEVRLFSYFKNLPLLAAFLGLAIGFSLVHKKRDYRPAFAPLFGIFVLVVLITGRVISPRALAYPSRGEDFLWFTGNFPYLLALLLFLGIVIIFFVLTMLIFIPLGQATGEEMARHPPNLAYIVNLIASLAGIWMFALLSYLQAPPTVWFGLALLALGGYWASRRTLTRTELAVFASIPIVLAFLGQDIIWSPYHRLDIEDIYVTRERDGKAVKVGSNLKVQQVFYQVALDLSPEFLAELPDQIPEMEDAAYSYNLPYRLGPDNAQVLIVGAGMGNDVAAALRNNASKIDAVEIDPAILALGEERHPEKPYDDPRVTGFVDDARSFFEKNKQKYDVIAFGLLDSQTLLSGMSNVRLDSYVYTIESFEQVKKHLKENGLVSITFGADAVWIDERLGRVLAEVFGSNNIFYHEGEIGTTFIASPAPSALMQSNLTRWQPDPTLENLPMTTDNWPYLYLRTQSIPAAYWQALLLISVVCLIVLTRSFPEALRPNWHFWLLGAAFLLIEFKSITELALLFGTTWFVNVLAISGVLLMALLANLFVLWRPRTNLRLMYALLFASLGLSYFFPLATLTQFSPVTRIISSMGILSLPLLFASLIFGESLRQAGETSKPLASNLSGSVAGGVLEYSSLLWGLKSLHLVAALVYFGALIASQLQKE